MRQPGWLYLVGSILLLAATLSTAGCAVLRTKQSAKTASLQTVQGDLEYAQLQTRETREALSELAISHVKDLRRATRELSDRVGSVTTVGERLVRHADGMHDRGGDYLVEPEISAAECRFPRLSETAGTRPLELGEAFEPIARKGAQVKRAYREFASDLLSIRDTLTKYPTPRVVENLALFLRKAEVDGESLNNALEQALAAVQEAKMAPGYDEEQTKTAPEGVVPP